MRSRVELDRLDLAIVRELERDGRQTVSDLAKRVGASRNHVAGKLRRLLEQRVIKVHAWADPALLGLVSSAMIGINVLPRETKQVAESLKAFPNVHLVSIVAGRYDIVIWVIFDSAAELSRFLTEDLAQIPGITRTESSVVLENHKASFKYLAP